MNTYAESATKGILQTTNTYAEPVESTSTSHKFPKFVSKVTSYFDAWLIGSAANPRSFSVPRDYDVFIPFEKWNEVCCLIPETAKLNRFGGFKFVEDGKEIDVWTGDFQKIVQSGFFTYAYHPSTGTHITADHNKSMSKDAGIIDADIYKLMSKT